jgi:hypothetical protein
MKTGHILVINDDDDIPTVVICILAHPIEPAQNFLPQTV